jgi:hypothetical protein
LNLNQGDYAKYFETPVKKLSASGKVDIDITPVYHKGNNSERFDELVATYRQQGSKIETQVTFRNEPGGKVQVKESTVSDSRLINEVSSFKTHGVSQKEASDFLMTSDGNALIKNLQKADPKASNAMIIERAKGQIVSGSNLPKRVETTSPLVKIVPEGEGVSNYSPFFTTKGELDRVNSSGKSIADEFGLPLKSESVNYSIFEIQPKGKADVFHSNVAPTTELGGKIARNGGALQVIVPNRGA